MTNSLNDLPELCIVKILKFTDEDALLEVKLSCSYLYKLVRKLDLIVKRKRIAHVSVWCNMAENRCPGATCTLGVVIRKNWGISPTVVAFSHSSVLWTIRQKKRIFRRGYFQHNYDPILNAEEDKFEHSCESFRMLFQWMAKTLGNTLIKDFEIKMRLDEEEETALGCERLAREYGLRAVRFSNSCKTKMEILESLCKVYRNTVFRYDFSEYHDFISDRMLNYISTVKRFEGYTMKNGLHKPKIPTSFYKFPPVFDVPNGILAEIETVKKTIFNWWTDKLILSRVAGLELPMKYHDPAALAAAINISCSLDRIGFSHITIRKPGGAIHLRLSNADTPSETPRWLIYTSLTWKQKCAMLLPFPFVLDRVYDKWDERN